MEYSTFFYFAESGNLHLFQRTLQNMRTLRKNNPKARTSQNLRNLRLVIQHRERGFWNSISLEATDRGRRKSFYWATISVATVVVFCVQDYSPPLRHPPANAACSPSSLPSPSSSAHARARVRARFARASKSRPTAPAERRRSATQTVCGGIGLRRGSDWRAPWRSAIAAILNSRLRSWRL